MKSSSVAFCLGLVINMALSSSAIPRSFDNGSCCYKFYTGKIDSKGILKVMKTDSRCSKQGFIETEKISELHTPAENIKMNRVFLVLGFVLIMALYSGASPPLPEDCCFTFFSGSIPSKNILNVKKTGSGCTEQGFIVKWPKYEVCVQENPLKIN
ncbi:hypothetical protein Q7C36_013162 [Tachysurus vachellii]|uniref:Chemokine interleukin-8-like domain-containing protein n=1 Tax=Tachysurus vachellii TaxID=175792 RepID=A0AA88MHT0_TACVA|nr:hypothetical protein Q7C36_013162 [Tachysurus vachellii]